MIPPKNNWAVIDSLLTKNSNRPLFYYLHIWNPFNIGYLLYITVPVFDKHNMENDVVLSLHDIRPQTLASLGQ